MRVKPWEMPDGLWQRIEPLLPKKQRRFRYAGRKPLDDRKVLQGILFVLHTVCVSSRFTPQVGRIRGPATTASPCVVY
jgi:transposase